MLTSTDGKLVLVDMNKVNLASDENTFKNGASRGKHTVLHFENEQIHCVSESASQIDAMLAKDCADNANSIEQLARNVNG
tara:strand:+ start:331 stop:570 length:240 start_codon:yes stop_codon:yes gene_type:complete